MSSESPQPLLPKPWRIKATAFLIIGIICLMFLTNPTSNGFQKYLREYVKTESGSTIAPHETPVPSIFLRTNYYIYSAYSVNIEGVEHHYIGMFGSFHNYN